MRNKISTLFCLIVMSVIAAISIPSANAQKAGASTTVLTGQALTTSTNNTLATASTNLYYNAVITNGTSLLAGATNATTVTVLQNVSEFDNCGITFTFSGASAAATNGNVVLRIAKSFDGGVTKEATPSIAITVAGTGLGAYASTTNYPCVGASHLFVTALENGTAGTISNAVVTFYLKSVKYGAKVATQ